jgi:PknH-like extracellular domain
MFGIRIGFMTEYHGGVGLAAVMTAGALALAGCSSPSKAPATSPATSTPTSAAPTSSQAAAPPTSTAPRVPEDRLGSFLLTADEGNAIMGSTDMQDLGGLATMDTNAFAVSNPDCLGAAHIVQPPVYSDSGYTAVKFDVLHKPGLRYTNSIEQALTTYPSADQALAFVQTSAGKWKSCGGQDVTESLNGGSTKWTFGNLVGDPPKISIIMNRHNARGYTCQRVLSAVRNAVIDVKACAFKISDQGVQAADKIAAKATQ